MPKKYKGDDMAGAMKVYGQNHPEWGQGSHVEFQFWKVNQGLTAIPWGVGRYTAINTAATSLGLSLTETAPWPRECEFWALYNARPPTPAP